MKRQAKLFDGVDLEIDHHKHKPNQVAKMLFQKLMICMIQKITGDQLIILNEEVKSFTDICGACERIKTLSYLFLQRFP
jgi:putative membrane protein